jgi:hypothetical protein
MVRRFAWPVNVADWSVQSQNGLLDRLDASVVYLAGTRGRLARFAGYFFGFFVSLVAQPC